MTHVQTPSQCLHIIVGATPTCLQAPVCVQKPHYVTEHGDSRYDPFYWLRSDSRDDPEVLAYIKAENAYCKEVLADTEGLQKILYDEMRSRIQEADTSAPVPRDGFFYYKRTLEGKQYTVHCRRRIGDVEGPIDESVVMDLRWACRICSTRPPCQALPLWAIQSPYCSCLRASRKRPTPGAG